MTSTEITAEEVHALAEEFDSAEPADALRWCWERYGTQAGIGTSFQGAGLVTIHQALTRGFRFPIFTVDTQFLFPETLELKRQLEEFFDAPIEPLLPEQSPEQQALEHGPELWKRSPDLCCSLRKVLPLQKKLETLNVWITGVRRDQSDHRRRTGVLELYKFDVLRDHNILKLNPLAGWSREKVWDYIREHGIPYNPLHDRGYRSIGCVQCTRAVGEGESERAGRWTGFDKSECGIHTFLGDNI